MEDYDCIDLVYELNVAAAKLAKAATQKVTKAEMHKPRCAGFSPRVRTVPSGLRNKGPK